MITKSAKDTQKIGFNLAQKIKEGDIVCLYGDLGFGKTTFVQGFAKGLGIEKRIISPTFVIVRTYNIKRKSQNSNRKTTSQSSKLYHIDLYRVQDIKNAESLGLEEIINDPSSIKVIEWPEKIKNMLPKNTISVHFEYLDENSRKITIKNEK